MTNIKSPVLQALTTLWLSPVKTVERIKHNPEMWIWPFLMVIMLACLSRAAYFQFVDSDQVLDAIRAAEVVYDDRLTEMTSTEEAEFRQVWSEEVKSTWIFTLMALPSLIVVMAFGLKMNARFMLKKQFSFIYWMNLVCWSLLPYAIGTLIIAVLGFFLPDNRLWDQVDFSKFNNYFPVFVEHTGVSILASKLGLFHVISAAYMLIMFKTACQTGWLQAAFAMIVPFVVMSMFFLPFVESDEMFALSMLLSGQ